MMWFRGLGISYLSHLEMFSPFKYVILESLLYATLSQWVVILEGTLPSREQELQT